MSNFSEDPVSSSEPQPGHQPQGYPQQPPAGQKTNTLAIISLVTGFCISLAAIITGHIALSQIKKTGEKGRGLAIAGLVLGYLGVVAGIIVSVVMIAGLIIAAEEATSPPETIYDTTAPSSPAVESPAASPEPIDTEGLVPNAATCAVFEEMIPKTNSAADAEELTAVIIETYEGLVAADGVHAELYSDYLDIMKSDDQSGRFSGVMVQVPSISSDEQIKCGKIAAGEDLD